MHDPRRAPVLRALPVALALAGGGCSLIERFTEPESLSIQKFTVLPATEVTAGSSITLSWEVEGADSVQIDHGIGTVLAKGSKTMLIEASTTFTLSAHAGTSAATASVEVTVRGSGPLPSPSPSPSPGPSPSPTPLPSPSPSPSPSPGPSPSPSPSPEPVTCGATATPENECALTITRHAALDDGQCLELNKVTLDRACPVGINTVRALSFKVTAHMPTNSLNWRRADSSSDVLTPAGGSLSSDGKTIVDVSDIVLDDQLKIEILDGNKLLLSFAINRY